MIRGWMGGFDSIGAYSGRNHTDSDDMISWREALVPISIFCNPVLWFLVGFLLISCCRDEKGFWQCPCRPRRDRASESVKTSTTNISTLHAGSSGGLSSQLDLELGLTVTGRGGGGSEPAAGRFRSLRRAGSSAGRSRDRRVPRARSAQLLPVAGLHSAAGGSLSPVLSSPLGRRGSVQRQTERAADPPPPPSHILLTPAELHTTAAQARGSADRLAPSGSSKDRLAPPVRPLRRSLDDRMLRPRPTLEPFPDVAAPGSQRPSRRSLEERRYERGAEARSYDPGERRYESGGDEEPLPADRLSPRRALLHQHVKHASLLKLPPVSTPPRPRPVSLQETHLHLQPLTVDTSALYRAGADTSSLYRAGVQQEGPPAYPASPQDDSPPLYHSLHTEHPPTYLPSPSHGQSPLYHLSPSQGRRLQSGGAGAVPGLDPSALYRLCVVPQSQSARRPQRVSLQEVRLTPSGAASTSAAAPRRPQRVSLQEASVHGGGGGRTGRKCGVVGYHCTPQGRPWTLDLAELAEK